MKTLLSIIAILSALVISSTNLTFAEVQLNNAILAPFKDNELVLVGKVNDVKNMSSKNNTQYSITVEKYLKNSKPFDLLTATGYGTRKEITNPYQENYFNQPMFEKGDRVFLYLNQKNGQYVLSPLSFIISEHIPPGTAITVIPNKNNYYGNENVSILGVINKGHLYTSAAEYGKNSTVSITVFNPNNAKYLTDQINVKPDGSFIYQFKIKGKFGITGGYGSFIDAGGSGSGVTFDYVADPLNQFKSGISSRDVKCGNDFTLVIKSTDNSPACVKPQTKAKLVERGWALSSLNDLSTDKGVFQSVIKMPVDDVGLQCEKEFKLRSFEHTVFSNGTSLTINYVPVFLMKPNSTGKICITTWSDDKSSKYEMKTSAGISKDYSETSDATVVLYPENIVIDNTNKTIIYAITTTGNANGFYRIGTNWDSCGGGLPLAVGYDSSHSFDNDFPWLWETYPCPFGSGIPSHMQITGLTGIDVAYITKVYD